MAVEAEHQRQWSPKTKVQQFRSSPTLVLVTVCVAIFNDVFLFGTIIPVLPYALPDRVPINPKDVQIWIAVLLAAYGGALFLGSLMFGWLGDRLPRRHGIFLFGISCLLGATLLLSLGRNMALLMFGRFFQGLAAAVVWTSGLAILTDLFGQGRYGEAMGYGQTSVSIGTTCAPLMGGVVYSRGGYQAVSAMSNGAVALSLVLALIMVEPQRRTEQGEQSSGKGGQDYSQDQDSDEQEAPPLNGHTPELPNEWSALIPKTFQPRKVRHGPAYPFLLRSGRILAAMGGIFTFSFVIVSFEGIIPLFVKETFHWDSIHAALIFLTWIIPGFLGPIAGKTVDRYGSKWPAIGGFSFAVAPLILMRLVTRDSTGHKVLLCALLTMVGLGFVWIVPSCVSDLQVAAADLKRERPDDFGESGALTQAFALFVVAYACGTFVGPTVAGIIKARSDWGTATIILACTCIAACVPIYFKTPVGTRNR